MGADGRPGSVVPIASSFALKAVAAMQGLLCSSTRLSWVGLGRRNSKLVSEFGTKPADSASNLSAALVADSDYRFYDSCCFPGEVS